MRGPVTTVERILMDQRMSSVVSYWEAWEQHVMSSKQFKSQWHQFVQDARKVGGSWLSLHSLPVSNVLYFIFRKSWTDFEIAFVLSSSHVDVDLVPLHESSLSCVYVGYLYVFEWISLCKSKVLMISLAPYVAFVVDRISQSLFYDLYVEKIGFFWNSCRTH